MKLSHLAQTPEEIRNASSSSRAQPLTGDTPTEMLGLPQGKDKMRHPAPSRLVAAHVLADNRYMGNIVAGVLDTDGISEEAMAHFGLLGNWGRLKWSR
jgi:hypothetical protein